MYNLKILIFERGNSESFYLIYYTYCMGLYQIHFLWSPLQKSSPFLNTVFPIINISRLLLLFYLLYISHQELSCSKKYSQIIFEKNTKK